MEIAECIQARMLRSVKPTRQFPEPFRIACHPSEVKLADLPLRDRLGGLELVDFEEAQPIIMLEFTLANENSHLHLTSRMSAGGSGNHGGLDGNNLEGVGKATHGIHEGTAIAVTITATDSVGIGAISTSTSTTTDTGTTAITSTVMETMMKRSAIGHVRSTLVGVDRRLADGRVGRDWRG